MINNKQLVAMDIAWLASQMSFEEDSKVIDDIGLHLLNDKISISEAEEKINKILPRISYVNLLSIRVFNSQEGIKDLRKKLLISQIIHIQYTEIILKQNQLLLMKARIGEKMLEILRLTKCKEFEDIHQFARKVFDL